LGNFDRYFFILANVFLGVGTPHSCAGAFSGYQGGIQVLGGLVPYGQTIGFLLRARAAKPFGKISEFYINDTVFGWCLLIWQLSRNSFVQGIILYAYFCYLLWAIFKPV